MRLGIVFALISAVALGQEQDVIVRIPRRCDMAQVEWPMVRCTTSTGEISVIPAPGEAPVELADLPDSIPTPMCRITVDGKCVEWNDAEYDGLYGEYSGPVHGLIADIIADIPKPDPADVPAVHHKHRTGTWCIPDIRYCEGIYDETWTCADKSRFLLKDEGGDYHCLKLSGREQ